MVVESFESIGIFPVGSVVVESFVVKNWLDILRRIRVGEPSQMAHLHEFPDLPGLQTAGCLPSRRVALAQMAPATYSRDGLALQTVSHLAPSPTCPDGPSYLSL